MISQSGSLIAITPNMTVPACAKALAHLCCLHATTRTPSSPQHTQQRRTWCPHRSGSCPASRGCLQDSNSHMHTWVCGSADRYACWHIRALCQQTCMQHQAALPAGAGVPCSAAIRRAHKGLRPCCRCSSRCRSLCSHSTMCTHAALQLLLHREQLCSQAACLTYHTAGRKTVRWP